MKTLQEELQFVHSQAHQALQGQRDVFRECAQKYEQEARDVTKVEVIQGELRERANAGAR